MMNPELKQKWVAALRSGDYEQARGALGDGTGYCCLGVLCDIDPSVKIGKDGYAVFPGGSISDDSLTTDYALSIGVPTVVESRLIEMNDDFGKSFEQIALHIERNIP